MRILTFVRQVLDAEESVSIQDGSVALDGRKLVLDTMDEYGVEEALRLREAGATEAEIIALAIGPLASKRRCARLWRWERIAPFWSRPTRLST